MNEIIRKLNSNNLSKGLRVKWKGELDLAGFKLPCFVLEDGTRILSSRSMESALKMIGENGEQERGPRLRRYLEQKTLQPFLYRGNKEGAHFDPIICYDGGTEIRGYEATRLADFCDGMLEARKTIHLSPRQRIIADQCELLLRSFAKVGIIALIDEVTGYQYERERDELQKQLRKVLGLYVSEKPKKWQKVFPWTFYKQLFRLWGQPFTVEIIIKPGFIGRLTNKYVYGNLPHGVLEKLKEKTPKTEKGNWSRKLHQLLTTEIGREDLKKTINSIETLASISENKQEFEKFEAKYRQQKELLYTGLVAKDEKQISDEKERIKKDFDRQFKALLSVPLPESKTSAKQKDE